MNLKSNLELIKSLVKKKVINSAEVEKVMLEIDRKDFIDYNPYYDGAQSIPCNATISAPHMHAYALELLRDNLKNAKKTLDIGSGTGYLTLAFSKMMQNGVSYGIEHIQQLSDLSIKNIQKNNANLINDKKIIIINGDGREGYKEGAPFDCIHVGAASEKIPQQLLDQLALGGRLLIPVGKPGYQEFLVIDKDQNGKITQNVALGVTYIPLTSVDEQINKYY